MTAMNAIPELIPAREVDPFGAYVCPLCRTQTTGDEVDSGWVRCPMLDDAFIDLGCCLDYQPVARSADFAAHPFRELFDETAWLTGKEVATLRSRCLEHQASIVQEDLSGKVAQRTKRELERLLAIIRAAQSSVTTSGA
ncbi:MAG: hypothetical protein ACM30E_11470 [Nitrososphaerales archaeon]